jgi:hypothetical protein
MSEEMWIAALYHTEMAQELAALWTTVSSIVEFKLGCSPDETIQVEVVDELVAKFQKPEERCSWLERPGARIYDLLLVPLSNQAWLADCLDEAVRYLGAKLATRREADDELEALRSLVASVRDLMLDRANGPSSLVASLSAVAELLEDRVNAVAANGVRWGLVATLSHFLKLEAELELLGSRCNMALTEDQVDALWILARLALNLLESHVLPSVARNPPDGAGE